MTKEIIINGSNFSSLVGFYDEIDNKLTKDLDWNTGKNLDAVNDILRGGFGVFGYEEAIKLVWKNSEKSKKDLGFPETIKYLEKKLKTCHPSNISFVEDDLEEAKKGNGKTLFELILAILHEHKHLALTLE